MFEFLTPHTLNTYTHSLTLNHTQIFLLHTQNMVVNTLGLIIWVPFDLSEAVSPNSYAVSTTSENANTPAAAGVSGVFDDRSGSHAVVTANRPTTDVADVICTGEC